MARVLESPLRTLTLGLAAGVIGTAAMTGWQELSARLQDPGEEGGDEPSNDDEAWEQASAPAKVAAKASEAVLGSRPPAERIPLITGVMHWGYGTSWGAVYGAARQGSDGAALLRDGALLGTGVWAASYAQLVPMGLYEPPWKYPPKELAMDLSYHLVYGLAAAGAHRLLVRGH